MHSRLVLGASGGMLPREILIKMVRSGAILALQSMLLPSQKAAILRLINQQQQKLIATFFPEVNLDVHVIRNKIHLEFTRRSGRRNFKKSNKMEAFPLFFFLLFGRAP